MEIPTSRKVREKWGTRIRFSLRKHVLSPDMKLRFLILLVLSATACFGQKIAITFDDLPLNGSLPPGVTRAEIARSAIAILKKHHAPAVYGFINSKKLEGDADAAEAFAHGQKPSQLAIIRIRIWT